MGRYLWKATEFCKQTNKKKSVARATIRAIIVRSKRHFLVSKTQSPNWNGDFASQKPAAPSDHHGWTVWTNDLRLIFSSLGCDETVSKASKLREQTQKPLTLTLQEESQQWPVSNIGQWNSCQQIFLFLGALCNSRQTSLQGDFDPFCDYIHLPLHFPWKSIN